MSSWAVAAGLMIGLSGVVAGMKPAVAADTMKFASPAAAYHAGTSAMRDGRVDEALQTLEYAADKGVLGAMRKLARLYAAGEGVPQSNAKAFGYYQRIADEFADMDPRHRHAKYAAEAFMALAAYYRSGLPELGVSPDPVRAAGLCQHAASYFGNAKAQFMLARMYLAGDGVTANIRLAVNWLANAAKKRHAPSQALLGDLLWRTDEVTYHKPLKGLALLALASRNAAGTADAKWIGELYDRAVGEAAPEQRKQAWAIAERWGVNRKNRSSGLAAASQARSATPQGIRATDTVSNVRPQ